MNVKCILPVLLLGAWSMPTLALNLSQGPLINASVDPRILLLISRDHQLSMKAFTDYTNLTGDVVADSTYNDAIDYNGYFDFGRCYTYNDGTGKKRFEPAEAVATRTHKCGGSTWSGNFLNWASMTRMDLLRKTLYGGYRSTDTVGTGYETVLERQFLPVDVHAFVKVYTPTGTMPSIQSLTGRSGQTSISLCNVTDTTSTTLTGQMAFPLASPLIKVASGTWPQWDASEVTQCAVNIGNSTQPTVLLATYNARVQVCVTDKLESNCKPYTHPTTAVQILKPTGLLQKYGDVDADRRTLFGLMTGSYAANKSGGVLRKNVLHLTNNNNTSITSSDVCGDNNANDEIDVCTGQFINQSNADAGIINTLNRLHIAGFQYTSAGRNGSHQYSCNSPGILSFTNGHCVDWGNPLGEMYLEALRYFANAGATSAFNVSDISPTKIIEIPQVTWTDPLPTNEWCGLSSIVVLSTGLNSFDTDELASFTPNGGTAIDAAALTVTVGDATHENLNGKSYLIGDLIDGTGADANNQCTAKTVTDLAHAKGICPEVPSLEGGYAIAGLAYAPKTIDLRHAYLTNREARWGGSNPINKDWALRQPLNTYVLQLAESLPSFSPTVGTGKVTLLPACQANSSGGTGAWTTSATGWRNCSMTNLIVDTNVAQADVGTDTTAKTKTCSGNGASAQCYTITWEDSTWGNDYDMDGIQRLGYCVGTACGTFKMLCPIHDVNNSNSEAYATIGPWTNVASAEIKIVTCAIQANAGHALTFGYTVSGSSNDGPSYPILRPGGANFNVGDKLPASATSPDVTTFTQGTSSASLLKSPLWYAAKYGGFTESTPTIGIPAPNVTSEWDADGNGIPDNYYEIRNPALLAAALSSIFDAASQPDASAAAVATNSTNLQINSRIFQAKFSSADWSGQLLSYRIDTNGVLTMMPEWDAGDKMNAQQPGDRTIITRGSTEGVPFIYSSLSTDQQASFDRNAAGVTDHCGADRVDFLRGSADREGISGIFTNGTCTATKFRQRLAKGVHFKLGDIIDSSPWYVGAPQAGFADASYTIFRKGKLNRKPVVYVGGNDGMLHGFDASLTMAGQPTSTAGNEILAYVPSAVFPRVVTTSTSLDPLCTNLTASPPTTYCPNVSYLAAQSYNKNHRYFVDGSPMVADADMGTGDWRTVLVGSLGGGGKGYYALDISDPATFSEGSAANLLLWEFGDADDSDMGNVFNLSPSTADSRQAKQIVRVCTAGTASSCTSSRWAVVLGNGYRTGGGAVLYVAFIGAGSDGHLSSDGFVKITAAAAMTAVDNGLSTPVPIDSDGDGYADTVYAGDLQGNLWKFLIGPNASDVSVTDTATAKVAFSGAPLFVAQGPTGSRQPIVAPPEVIFHDLGGQMLFIGTGKYLETTDNLSTAVQTLYGIWDRHDGATRVAVGGRSRGQDLLKQTVTAGTAAASLTAYRIVSTNPINWRTAATGADANCTGTCTATHLGWYLDLMNMTSIPMIKPGERNTGIPKRVRNLIFFNTLIPSTAAAGTKSCDAGGTGFLMVLDWKSGGQPSFNIFDTNGDGMIDSKDKPVAGYQVGAALGGSTLITGAPGAGTGVSVSSLVNGRLVSTLINFGFGNTGRLNWREILR
ncbi:PilC/PilY family type IV pilus protein [uncultured Thiodictyon sp.]|uniref:pilus assembly protein n=1 Tax=uncultured Thiodictyon sp. TaxID=1846217 RepID=UPI0025E9BA8B|nr:PilC/PilY family type IV pilus protein [uncultured Thiodictyon sp.]